jgi:PPP family 3-phenylpropionic acid transporter
MMHSIPTRLSLFYGLHYVPMGLHLPFMALFYELRGISPSELGAIGFLCILVRVATDPVFGSWIDRRGQARRVITWLSIATIAVFALNIVATGFWPLLLVAIVYTVVRSPVGPISEAIGLQLAMRDGLDFARMRSWGSAGFLATTLIGGSLVAMVGIEALPALLLLFFFVSLIGALSLPEDPREVKHERPRAPVRHLLRQPIFIVFLAASSFIQASNAVIYQYAPLHWRDVGLSTSEMGWIWSISTILEIALFWFAGRRLERVDPICLLATGAAISCLRWTLTAFADTFWQFALLQCLHTGTFGISFLGALHFIARRLPASHAASAQTLHASAYSILLGVAIIACGPLFERYGGRVYLVMTLFCVISLAACGLLARMSRTK